MVWTKNDTGQPIPPEVDESRTDGAHRTVDKAIPPDVSAGSLPAIPPPTRSSKPGIPICRLRRPPLIARDNGSTASVVSGKRAIARKGKTCPTKGLKLK